jgi:hypothetical protein
MYFFSSPLLGETIVILEDGDKSVGSMACYSKRELDDIQAADLSKEARIQFHLMKKTFQVSEGEWRFQDGSFVRTQGVPEVSEEEEPDTVSEDN